ncbi:MAG: hypothetical protein V1859_06050 [archaeon]
MRRKAQSLSMNTIIVAALALLVLIIIALIFTGRIKITREGIDNCGNNGGRCVSNERTGITGPYRECSGSYDKVIIGKCPNEDQICCLTT